MSGTRKIGCVVQDLFFSARINTTAKALGVEVIDVKPDDLLAWCRDAKPDLVILDLHGAGDPIDVGTGKASGGKLGGGGAYEPLARCRAAILLPPPCRSCRHEKLNNN